MFDITKMKTDNFLLHTFLPSIVCRLRNISERLPASDRRR